MTPLKTVGTLPGLAQEPERAIRDALNGVITQLNLLGRPGRVTKQQTTNYSATEGDLVRMRGGLRLNLPRARQENQGATVMAFLETPGTLTITATSSTLNGKASVEVTQRRLISFTSNGAGGWFSSEDFEADSADVADIVTSFNTTFPSDAEFLLRAAHSDLPNGRVTAASTEITPDYSSAGLVSWALNVASVAFSKLANLTGLSVLGRAANSAGVMAAITAAAGDRYLRSNTGGTALEFGNPASTSVINTAGTFQVAAYTGAISKAQNATATLFAGLGNGLTGNSTATATLAARFVDDANVLLGTAFELRGEDSGTINELWSVVGSQASLAYEVNTAANFSWTGTHDFQAQADFSHIFRLTGTFTSTLAATTSNLAIGNANAVILTLTGSQRLTGMVPAFDGQMVWLENTDSVDVLFLDHDITSTGANRFYLPLSEEYRILARSGAWFRYNGTLQRWILADSKQFTGLSVRESPSVTSGVRTIALLDTTSIALSKTTPGASDDLDLSADLIVAHMPEQASSPTVGAGNGMFWVDDAAPTQGMFTDDVEADWAVGYAAVFIKTTNSAATNATSNLSCGTYGIPADTLRVGSCYRLRGYFIFTHTAAATPTITVELLINGAVVDSFVVSPKSSADDYCGQIEALITCRTTGAGGTVMATVTCANSVGVTPAGSTDEFEGTKTTATTAIDTTASRSIELRCRMTTAVASNTLTVTQGSIERLA